MLVIEDDPDMRDNTCEMLELAGYRVLKATDGRHGVEVARTEVPDLVLCDVMMPELDGYGVLKTLGHDPRTAEVPFIFLTAKTERSDVRKGMELGADDYLTKPFAEEELLGALEARLKRNVLFRKGFDNGFTGLNQFFDHARGLEALQHISKERRSRRIPKKEVFFREGDELHHILYIVEGKVRTFKINNEGKELVTGLHGPGDFVGYMGLLQTGHASETAEAIEDTESILIPREDLFALLYRDRDVSIRFIKMLAREVNEKEVLLLALAYASVRQRVAQALLRVHARYGNSPEELGARMSREELATIVGTATESVIRSLSDLKDAGLIESHGREIRILDKGGLERVAQS